MASFRRDLMLAALCVVALLAVGSESHGLQEEFGQGKTEATPEMASFFGADKPEAAVLPEALPAKPEATSAMPTTTSTTNTASSSSSSAPPRRSVAVAAGISCGIAALAVVGVAVAVAFVVRARRGERREAEVHLG
ncbi:uncharacterized protein [Lolium perenne]|uniref:uncharacterized protein n=1 Tax=Lolium perenne TaxID=4522 RepID=UPI0021F5D838|nr:uncharacterized protein LOC127336137 [Lolium perenne]